MLRIFFLKINFDIFRLKNENQDNFQFSDRKQSGSKFSHKPNSINQADSTETPEFNFNPNWSLLDRKKGDKHIKSFKASSFPSIPERQRNKATSQLTEYHAFS